MPAAMVAMAAIGRQRNMGLCACSDGCGGRFTLTSILSLKGEEERPGERRWDGAGACRCRTVALVDLFFSEGQDGEGYCDGGHRQGEADGAGWGDVCGPFQGWWHGPNVRVERATGAQQRGD